MQYTVSGGKIQQSNPGAFFYWVQLTAAQGSNTFVINQSITTGNFQKLFAIASGSSVFNSSCSKVQGATFTQTSTTGTSDTVTVKFTAPTAGTYIISVKFDTQSGIAGQPAPNPSTVGYSYSTTNVAGSTQSLSYVKKH